MDLETIAGPHWQGWTLNDDGMLYAPEWRQGLHSGDIRALPYLHASIADLTKRLKTAQAALQDMERVAFDAERAAQQYRRMVSREARFGLMLSRVTGQAPRGRAVRPRRAAATPTPPVSPPR